MNNEKYTQNTRTTETLATRSQTSVQISSSTVRISFLPFVEADLKQITISW